VTLTHIDRWSQRTLGSAKSEPTVSIVIPAKNEARNLPHVLAGLPPDVPGTRLTLRYFILRCFAEGLSKAAVSRYAGTDPVLVTERDYAMKVLPGGVARGLRKAVWGHTNGPGEALMILVGFAATVAGYVGGRFGLFSKLVAIWGDRGIRGRNMPRSIAP
jgi:hypothetical protein